MDTHVPRDTLDAALAHVLDAPTDAGPVHMLCRRPDRNQRDFPDSLLLDPVDGVAGDYEMAKPWLTLADGTPDPRIQVSILPLRVLDLVWRDRETTAFPGDTIIADLNLTLDNLPVGTRLQVGSAVLEVSDLWNEGCAKWKVRYGRAAYEWTSAPAHEPLRLRGIFCRILRAGEVRLGDRITKSPA